MNKRVLWQGLVFGALCLSAASVLLDACSSQGGPSSSTGKAGAGGSAGATAGAGGSAGSGPGGGGGGTAGASPSGGAGDAGTASGGSGGSGGGAGAGGSRADGGAGTTGAGGQGGLPGLPDPGTAGDGDSMIGPTLTTQTELMAHGNPAGKSFTFTMPLAQSALFDGKDPTLDPTKPVNTTRMISVYVPAKYQDGTPAPVLVIQDGPGEINQVKNALDNLTIDPDPMRRLPPFIAVAVENGGNDSIGSERGLEYDTMSDKYARFIDTEVLPAVQANAAVKAAYPNLKFTKDPSGRASLGCSSGAAAAFTMGWFRPDLFGRIISYSGTLVAQQNPKAPEAVMYPDGAWDYHSDKQLIMNDTMKHEKLLRIFLNVNENDNGSTAPESGKHNWVIANQRTAAVLKTKAYHYKYVYALGKGHCDGSVQSATLADALMWVWRGYQPSGM